MKLFIKLSLAIIVAVMAAQGSGAHVAITSDELQIIQIVQGIRSTVQPDSSDYYICEVDSVLNHVESLPNYGWLVSDTISKWLVFVDECPMANWSHP